MGEVSTVSKRGGCGAKYRNRIMSFLSMLHRFHISPASLVAPSPCHSSSLTPPFSLEWTEYFPRATLLYKRDILHQEFSIMWRQWDFFFSFSPPNKKHLYRFWQQDIGQFPHLERRILQSVRSCSRTDPDYISTPVKKTLTIFLSVLLNWLLILLPQIKRKVSECDIKLFGLFKGVIWLRWTECRSLSYIASISNQLS